MPTQLRTQTCDCGESEFYFTRDDNLKHDWKRGNKYCRICTSCGNRYFLAKSMYRQVSDKYIIPSGEEEVLPLFNCPACDEEVCGRPAECPFCDAEYEWTDKAGDMVDPDPPEDTQGIPDDQQAPADDQLGDPDGPDEVDVPSETENGAEPDAPEDDDLDEPEEDDLEDPASEEGDDPEGAEA